MTEEKPYTLDRIVRSLITVAILGALVWLVRGVAEVLVPLVVGVLLAYLLDPVVRLVERKIKNRTAAVILTVSALILVVAGSVAVIAPVITDEIGHGVRLARETFRPGSPIRERLEQRIPEEAIATAQELVWSPEVQQWLREDVEVRHLVINAARRVVPQLWGLLSGALSIVGVILQIVLILVYLVFLLIDYRKFHETWQMYLPPRYREAIVSFLGEFNDALACYFRGQFVVAAIVGVLFAIGFSVVGIRMAILLGLLVGALNMVPYLQIVGFVPALMLGGITAAEHGGGLLFYTLGVCAVFVIVQALQEVVITPRVMGEATGLRPVIILFCVLFWGKLLGFLGILLAIPLTCLGLAYYRRMLTAQTEELAQA